MKMNLNDMVESRIPKLKCYCHHHCPGGDADDGICEVDIGGRCFAAVEEVINTATGFLEPEYSYGCFSAGDPAFLQCKGHLVMMKHDVPASIACCDSLDFCNEELRPMYKPSNITDHLSPFNPPSDYYLLQLLLAAVISLLLLTFCIVLYIVCKYRAREKNQKYQESDSNKSFLLSPTPSKEPYFTVDQSSGSGSGIPLLVQRTVGRQITLQKRIGKGRYGEVYLGELCGTLVAIKSFHSMEEHSWLREKQIYKLALIKHPNILVSMAWDIRSMDSITHMIIVTDYHPCGSLYDHLQHNSLTEAEALRLVFSTVAGISHLHHEIEGKSYKPAIAHRDIKSKNILVKNNGETCIADFGLAVCSVRGEKGVDVIPNIKVGTRRYMACEVLDDSMQLHWFESYRQADMYSFALILWEIGRRVMTESGSEKYECEEYAIPYYDSASTDPSFEEMKKLVCDQGIRPQIPARWEKSSFLKMLTKIMTECWSRKPIARLTALKVKKMFADSQDYSDKFYDSAIQIV